MTEAVLAGHPLKLLNLLGQTDPGLGACAPKLHGRFDPGCIVWRPGRYKSEIGNSRHISRDARTAFRAKPPVQYAAGFRSVFIGLERAGDIKGSPGHPDDGGERRS
jgi:hypothetical protein